MNVPVSESPPLHGLPLGELAGVFAQHGLSAHQARLVFQAIHRHGILDPRAMPEISAKCRAFLESLPPLPRLSVDAVHRAEDGTIKLRLTPSDPSPYPLPQGEREHAAIEAVIIPAERRVTLCVSCQVGCAAACGFCHTGTMGLLRNLAAWEIVEQYRLANEVWRDAVQQSKIENQKSKITNIVFMGMGEPLHNEAAVVNACRILGDGAGAGFSRRRIVMSTAGVGNRIRVFWEQGVASLALSLHATTDEARDRLVPLNRQWNVAALREILLSIPWRGRESVTIAYLLLDGVNDSRDDAARLAQWTAGLPAKINLLEFNPYPGCEYVRAGPEKLAAFRQWLHDFGVFNTLRRSRGQDVMAACGQLATTSQKAKVKRQK